MKDVLQEIADSTKVNDFSFAHSFNGGGVSVGGKLPIAIRTTDSDSEEVQIHVFTATQKDALFFRLLADMLDMAT